MNLLSRTALALVLAVLVCGSARAQVVLPQLNPLTLDTTFQSLNSNTPAMIDFVNQESFAVDVYWINFAGDRVLYVSDLAAGASYFQPTYLTHPWVVAMAGSGDTLAQGSGLLVGGFLAQTANPASSLALADTAYISAAPVPEPAGWLLMLTGLALAASAVQARRHGFWRTACRI